MKSFYRNSIGVQVNPFSKKNKKNIFFVDKSKGLYYYLGMMKNISVCERFIVDLSESKDSSLCPQISRGMLDILSFIIDQTRCKVHPANFVPGPGVEKCETMFRNLEAIPGRVKTNRGCFETASSLLKASPAKLETNPAKLKTNPARLETNPARLKTNPAELKTNPAELKTNPARLETNPAELKTNPARLETNPAKLKTNPAKLETNPARLKTNPAKLETNPAKLKTNPARLETNPARLKTNPAKLKTNPAELKTNPARPEKFPGVRNRSGKSVEYNGIWGQSRNMPPFS